MNILVPTTVLSAALKVKLYPVVLFAVTLFKTVVAPTIVDEIAPTVVVNANPGTCDNIDNVGSPLTVI